MEVESNLESNAKIAPKSNLFNSELYKLEIRNLGYFGIGELKKLLKNKLQLDYTKIKTPSGRDYAYVCMRTEKERERAIGILNGYKWKGHDLKAFAAKACIDPFNKRRDAKVLDTKKPINVRSVEEAACPLASVSYEEQLQKKKTRLDMVIQKFNKALRRVNPNISNISLNSFKCQEILPSPKIDAYRNKNEFTVGRNSLKEVAVGFRLCRYSDGSAEVAEVDQMPHIPDAAKWAAKSFQDFMRKSQFLPFDPETNSGHVKQLMVRNTASCNEIMVVVGVVTSNLSPDELTNLCNDLINFFQNCRTDEFVCTSLYYQDVKNKEVGQHYNPVVHLIGTTHITDTVCGLRFRISPLSFFQVNSFCTDVLYQQIIDLAHPNKNSVVLDICCGTGSIALAFSKYCKQVYGIEIVEEAIKDAEFNAKMNQIENVCFFNGNADDYIQCVVKEAVYNNYVERPVDIIAIVDPPRAGLHSRSIASIRACPEINKLIYVSCDPDNAQKNWIDLGRPESKQYKGNPFYPTKSIAVDMFPHTLHVEMVILFERYNSTN